MVGPETRNYAGKVDHLCDDARDADEAGFATAWIPQLPQDFDAMTAVALMGRETTRIELGTAVVPLQSRHPVALGQQALSVQAVCGGRFTLGVGPSHHWIVDTMLGLPYEQPAKVVEDYLDVFDAMFAGPGPVDVENDRFRIHNPLDITDLAPPVLLAALGPVMLRIAGERADGTVLWMADERAIAEHVVPRITKAAEGAGRPAPRSSPASPVVLCALPTRSTRRANARTASSATPSTRRTTSGCSSRATLPTSATWPRWAPKPTSSGGCVRTPTPGRPTSRSGSCPSATGATRSSPRPAGRASSWRRSRPSSRERARVRGDQLWPSLSAMAADAGARFGDAEAMVDGDRRVSFAELIAHAQRVTAALVASGIEPGERAAVWAPNRYEWLVAALGTLGAGAAVVPVNTRFKREEVRYILERSGARVVFTVGEFLGMDYAATVAELRPDLPEPRARRRVRRRGRRPIIRSTRSAASGATSTRRPSTRAGRRCSPTTCATCCSRRAPPARRRAC